MHSAMNLGEDTLAHFCKRHRIRRLSLCGSQLKGAARGDSDLDLLVLTEVLRPWLAAHNRLETRGAVYPFSPYSIDEALRRLLDVPCDSLVHTNETVYNLLTLGTSLDATVQGERKGRSLYFIDSCRSRLNIRPAEASTSGCRGHRLKPQPPGAGTTG